MQKQVICVSSFPKSGLTWLVRLLADVLNCPSAGSHPSQDKREIASEGWDRPGPYIVRKGHYRLDQYYEPWSIAYDESIPAPHVFLPDNITNERLIFMVRDPRDIIVSACHHWKARSRETIIQMVCHGGLARLPAWDEYLRQWLEIKNCKWTNYEVLYDHAFIEIKHMLNGLDYDESRLIPAIGRQSFDERKKQIAQDGDGLYLGKEYNLRFMRKGIVGDYKTFLADQEQDYIWKSLGTMMKRMGYEK